MENREHTRLRANQEANDESVFLDPTYNVFKFINELNLVMRSMVENYDTSLDLTDIFLVTLVKHYMVTADVVMVTKGQVYVEGVVPYWRVSYPTFNKRFNKLVRLHFFNPLGLRGSGGSNGCSEGYVPTIKQRLLDIKLNDTIVVNSK